MLLAIGLTASVSCTSDFDCSLAGECKDGTCVSYTCVCDAGSQRICLRSTVLGKLNSAKRSLRPPLGRLEFFPSGPLAGDYGVL